MKNKTTIILAIVIIAAAATVVFVPWAGDSRNETTGHSHNGGEEYYTCPMHPSVRSDRPGACPVCGMALVKKSANQGENVPLPQGFEGVSLSPTQRVMANVTTVPVSRRTLIHEIQAIGLVNYAEPNFLHISARFAGRLEKLYLTYPGQKVQKGDPVADVYSPEAVSAQQEFLIAVEWSERERNNGQSVLTGGFDLLEQSRKKLILWGFTDEQIGRLQSTRKVEYVVTMYSPISGTILKRNVDPQHYMMAGEDLYDVADLSVVWVYLDIYEKDIRFISKGQEVRITSDAYPGRTFAGTVAFIEPVLNAETRTVRVRTEFPNTDGRLKPNMYVNSSIGVPSTNTLAIPSSAIMKTGRRNVVWVEVGENMFEPRDVVTGVVAGSYTEILGGVREGEMIATTGGFLIDSESALQQPSSADPHAGHGIPADEGKTSQEVTIRVKGMYMPDVIRVKKGEKATLHFYRDEDARCTDEVVFEGLNIRRDLPAFQTTTIEFTPEKSGTYKFTCGMNMLHGTLIVE